MAHRPSAPKRTFLGVQALRGLAALMVVLHHSTQVWLSRANGLTHNDGWSNGAAGVDIFFIISGFVMTVSTAGPRQPSAATFLLRRVNRILPMYWIISLLALGKLALLHHSSPATALPSLRHLAASFLLLPSLLHGRIFVLLPVGWTLCFELFFYLLFAVALALRPRVSLLGTLTPVLLLLSLLGLVIHIPSPLLAFYLSPLLLEFLAGVALAHALPRLTRLPSTGVALPLLLAALGLAGLLLIPEHFGALRVLAWGFPALLLVTGSLLLEPHAARLLPTSALRLGDASYSLYLCHPLLLALLGTTLLRVPLLLHSITAFTVVSAALCIAAARVLFRHVEAPLAIALNRRSTPTQPPPLVLDQPRAAAA